MRTALLGTRRNPVDDLVRHRMDTLFGPNAAPRPAHPAHPGGAARSAAAGPGIAEVSAVRRPVSAAPLSDDPSPPEAALPPPTPVPVPAPLPARGRGLLPLALQERFDLDRRAVVGLSVLLVLALGYGVQHFWAGRPETVPVPAAESLVSAVPSGPTARVSGSGIGAGTGSAALGAVAAGAVVVDVAGRVHAPGVRTLPAGARVQDALRAAGGALPGTDLTHLNLARVVNDGEEIVVGAPAPGLAAGAGAGGAGGAQGGEPVSLNAATAEQLDALPGLGPVLAQRIIQFREQHGGFRSVDQLRQVSGFGERRLKDLRARLRP